MRACILLSHVFVRSSEQAKLEQIEFCVMHYRLHNPNDYIILTGHGLSPTATTKAFCDFVYWPNNIIEQEIDKGHPRLVNIGIQHAISKRFTHLYKCRADGVVLRKNVIKYCQDLVGDKPILLTQQTELVRPRAGDLFMYGDVGFLKRCWNIDTWYPTTTGLTSFAKNILTACNARPEQWAACLRQNAEFVDIFNIKWVDFRANWSTLRYYTAWMIRNKLPSLESYLWGTTEKWHTFDRNGHMTSCISGIATEKVWYENNFSSRKSDRS